MAMLAETAKPGCKSQGLLITALPNEACTIRQPALRAIHRLHRQARRLEAAAHCAACPVVSRSWNNQIHHGLLALSQAYTRPSGTTTNGFSIADINA